MKLAGVVVWYNPSDKDVKNIQSYIDELDKLYIFDNSEKKDNKNKVPTSKKIEYISQHENLGIATALNITANKALGEGYLYLLTMDQDSKFKKDNLWLNNFVLYQYFDIYRDYNLSNHLVLAYHNIFYQT